MNVAQSQGFGNVAVDPRKRDRIMLFALCLIWLLPRGVASFYQSTLLNSEVWVVKKLLEYGFWNRWGGNDKLALYDRDSAGPLGL
jgi:hypothetical protein